MTTLSIPLPDDRLERLRSVARQIGVAPEELARASLEEWLDRPRQDFAAAAAYVLQKNADLYRRLA